MGAFVRILPFSCALVLGEGVFLAGLPWFGSNPQGALLLTGALLVLCAVTATSSIISKRAMKSEAPAAIMRLILAALIASAVTVVSRFLGIERCILGDSQYFGQETVRFTVIFNVLTIHLLMLRSTEKQKRMPVALILACAALPLLEATLVARSNPFPLPDAGLRVWLLIAITTHVLWAIPLIMACPRDRRT